MSKFKLTKEMMDINQDTIIKSGVCPNSPKGLFMTRENLGKELRWILLIEFHRWKVYTFWNEEGTSDKYVLNHGDKVHEKSFLKNILDFDDEVWELYRH